MSAFNRRFEERRLIGLPLPLAVGAAACGVSLMLAFMLSGLAAAGAGGSALVAAVATAYAVRYRSSLPFLALIVRNSRECGSRMMETGGRS